MNAQKSTSTSVSSVSDNFQLFQIEPGGLIPENLNSYHYGTGDYYYWSEDGKRLYYKFWYDKEDTFQHSGWGVYELATHSAITVTEPITYYPQIWQSLGIEPPENAEFRGFISPGENYVLYIMNYEDPNNAYGRSEIWLEDLRREIKTKLLEMPYRTGLTNAQWLPDESKVFFGYHLELGSTLCIADTQKGKLEELGDVSEFKFWNNGWALSPDGKTLAIAGIDALYLIGVENGHIKKKIDELSLELQWSKDGKRIYFWQSGPDECMGDEEAKHLLVYDKNDDRVSTAVDASVFEENDSIVYYSRACQSFSVSPDEKYMVFGRDEIWMLRLRNN